MGEMALLELDVQGIQNNWATFPLASWTNNLGFDIAIKSIHMQLVGADQLVGELALWVGIGNAWPLNEVFSSFGAELYTNPSTPIIKQVYFDDPDQITIPHGTTVSIVTNAGPCNLPGGGTTPAITYVAAAQMYYKKAGT